MAFSIYQKHRNICQYFNYKKYKKLHVLCKLEDRNEIITQFKKYMV